MLAPSVSDLLISIADVACCLDMSKSDSQFEQGHLHGSKDEQPMADTGHGIPGLTKFNATSGCLMCVITVPGGMSQT